MKTYLFANDIGWGHLSRCDAIAQELRARGHEAEVFRHNERFINNNDASVLVFDGVDGIINKDIVTVSINDFPICNAPHDLFVCPNIHPDSPFILNNSNAEIDLIGFNYFPRDSLFDDVIVSEEDYIFIAPGSAGISFDKLKKMLPNEKIIICDNKMTRLQFATYLAKAKLVISSASVAAMESCSLGKPTLIVQTANNQFYLYNSLVWSGAAKPFTRENLFLALRDKPTRAMWSDNARRAVPKSGTKLIVNKIEELI